MNSQNTSISSRKSSLEYRFKIIVIGNSVVGKTSLLSTYVDNNFQLNTVPTLGVDFKFKDVQVDDKVVQLQLWDTAGQDNFKSITKTYYKGADAVVMVYDLTNAESFQSLKNYWLSEVVNNSDAQVEILVLANKLDLTQSRQVSTAEGKKFADENNFQFEEVTAKDASNINEAFLKLVKTVLPHRSSLQSNQEKLKAKLTQKSKPKTCWDKFKSVFGAS